MRAVTSATAATVLGVERKAFDNMLTRLRTTELPRGRQGVARRIPVSVLPQLFLAAELTGRLGIPFVEAYPIAQSLAERTHATGRFLRLEVNLDALRDELDRRLEVAIESVVRPRRGRPRRRST